ncbi:hypothetical protein BCV69DRAFT_179314 [Microstroma glucosiphilum]|uniref:VHS domain-containing protein n=1 Tax=Pseudomicrostroma glucosiphilum TaxID=1684307 RepID=A0A316U6S7_9BASI|nr:hypothetical protein BCV69DRAFT_179314 [Pseudomicrostroma glucosiphilum]PWN20939.1 hypothetical protein BCV69DRAFT_179314 [Pseudomicrostroma glucosiphilum]
MKRLLAKGGAKGDLTPYQPDQRDSPDSYQGYPSPQQSHRIPLGDSGNTGYIPRQVNRRSYQVPTASPQPLQASMHSTYPAYEEDEAQHHQYGSHPPQHGRRASQGREALPESRSQQAISGAVGHHRPGFPPSFGSSYDGRAEGQITRETPSKKEGGLFKGLRRHQKTASRTPSSHMEELSMQRSYSNSPESSQFFASDAQHVRSHGPSRSGSSGSREEANAVRNGPAVYESYGMSSGEGLRSSHSLNRGEMDRQPESKKPGVNRMWAGLAARGRAIETMLHQEDKSADASRTGSPQASGRNDVYAQKVIPLGPQKKDKWFDLKGKGGAALKGRTHEEGEVTAKIGWLCSDRASKSDWSHILSFADTLAISEEASKEACQALRREFKLGEPESQKRAVKVWAVLFVNSSDLFRLQIVKKSFLEILEQTVIDPKTSLKVKERLLDAWAMLAYQYQGVPQLSALTKSYNRVCPSDRAMNGEPLDLEHEIFSVPSTDIAVQPARQSQQFQGQAPHQPPQQSNQQQAFYEDRHAEVNEHNPHAIAQDEEEVDQSEESDDGDDPDTIVLLFEACEVARLDASLLIDNLTSCGLHSSEVQELVRRCRHSLELLNSQMEWTNLQVARAHFRLAEERLLKETQGSAELPNGSSEGREVVQERLLASMEEARGMLVGSLGLVEETEREEREEEEERRVTELSKHDFRIDRSIQVQASSSLSGSSLCQCRAARVLRPQERRLQSSPSVLSLPSPPAPRPYLPDLQNEEQTS